MIKKLLLLFLILPLAGCNTPLGQIPPENNSISIKHFGVGGENVFVGGTEMTLGADNKVLEKKFKPEVKLEKWGDETYIRIWSDEEGDDKATEKDGKVVWNNKDKSKEYNFYTLPPGKGMENGRFEYEIILKEKPKTNVIKLNIEAQGLDFFYQPPLNEDLDNVMVTATEMIGYDIDGNIISERPENIVGSYAVYHSTRQGDYSKVDGKNYMAGKAFHIYRPKIIDSIGIEVWGELFIDIRQGILSVTIPQEFLDKAVYPINKVAGLEFGYHTIGGTSRSTSNDVLTGTLFTSTATAGIGDSISVYTTTASNNVKGVLTSSGKTIVSNGVGDGTAMLSNDWSESSFSTGAAVLASTAYYIQFIGDGQVDGKSDTGGSYCYDSSNSYTSPQNPTGCSTGTTIKYSVFCTYAPEAPPAEDLQYIRQIIQFN